jgi:hypothetical protein
MFALALALIPYAAGITTAALLWGTKADELFFATAAEVIALGAVAMALQGGFFQLRGVHGAPARDRYALATILISVGVGLGFAFGALARGDGGGEAHLAMTAGGLVIGISAFALQALFGPPPPGDDGSPA